MPHRPPEKHAEQSHDARPAGERRRHRRGARAEHRAHATAGLRPLAYRVLVFATSATSNARRLLDRATALLTAHGEAVASGDETSSARQWRSAGQPRWPIGTPVQQPWISRTCAAGRVRERTSSRTLGVHAAGRDDTPAARSSETASPGCWPGRTLASRGLSSAERGMERGQRASLPALSVDPVL